MEKPLEAYPKYQSIRKFETEFNEEIFNCVPGIIEAGEIWYLTDCTADYDDWIVLMKKTDEGVEILEVHEDTLEDYFETIK